ncbi:MAG: hypothetical protein Tsb005_12850 [Gammaproteobacteria bacterium]
MRSYSLTFTSINNNSGFFTFLSNSLNSPYHLFIKLMLFSLWFQAVKSETNKNFDEKAQNSVAQLDADLMLSSRPISDNPFYVEFNGVLNNTCDSVLDIVVGNIEFFTQGEWQNYGKIGFLACANEGLQAISLNELPKVTVLDTLRLEQSDKMHLALNPSGTINGPDFPFVLISTNHHLYIINVADPTNLQQTEVIPIANIQKLILRASIVIAWTNTAINIYQFQGTPSLSHINSITSNTISTDINLVSDLNCFKGAPLSTYYNLVITTLSGKIKILRLSSDLRVTTVDWSSQAQILNRIDKIITCSDFAQELIGITVLGPDGIELVQQTADQDTLGILYPLTVPPLAPPNHITGDRDWICIPQGEQGMTFFNHYTFFDTEPASDPFFDSELSNPIIQSISFPTESTARNFFYPWLLTINQQQAQLLYITKVPQLVFQNISLACCSSFILDYNHMRIHNRQFSGNFTFIVSATENLVFHNRDTSENIDSFTLEEFTNSNIELRAISGFGDLSVRRQASFALRIATDRVSSTPYNVTIDLDCNQLSVYMRCHAGSLTLYSVLGLTALITTISALVVSYKKSCSYYKPSRQNKLPKNNQINDHSEFSESYRIPNSKSSLSDDNVVMSTYSSNKQSTSHKNFDYKNFFNNGYPTTKTLYSCPSQTTNSGNTVRNTITNNSYHRTHQTTNSENIARNTTTNKSYHRTHQTTNSENTARNTTTNNSYHRTHQTTNSGNTTRNNISNTSNPTNQAKNLGNPASGNTNVISYYNSLRGTTSSSESSDNENSSNKISNITSSKPPLLNIISKKNNPVSTPIENKDLQKVEKKVEKFEEKVLSNNSRHFQVNKNQSKEAQPNKGKTLAEEEYKTIQTMIEKYTIENQQEQRCQELWGSIIKHEYAKDFYDGIKEQLNAWFMTSAVIVSDKVKLNDTIIDSSVDSIKTIVTADMPILRCIGNIAGNAVKSINNFRRIKVEYALFSWGNNPIQMSLLTDTLATIVTYYTCIEPIQLEKNLSDKTKSLGGKIRAELTKFTYEITNLANSAEGYLKSLYKNKKPSAHYIKGYVKACEIAAVMISEEKIEWTATLPKDHYLQQAQKILNCLFDREFDTQSLIMPTKTNNASSNLSRVIPHRLENKLLQNNNSLNYNPNNFSLIEKQKIKSLERENNILKNKLARLETKVEQVTEQQELLSQKEFTNNSLGSIIETNSDGFFKQIQVDDDQAGRKKILATYAYESAKVDQTIASMAELKEEVDHLRKENEVFIRKIAQLEKFLNLEKRETREKNATNHNRLFSSKTHLNNKKNNNNDIPVVVLDGSDDEDHNYDRNKNRRDNDKDDSYQSQRQKLLG